jgi:hypothetical protein
VVHRMVHAFEQRAAFVQRMQQQADNQHSAPLGGPGSHSAQGSPPSGVHGGRGMSRGVPGPSYSTASSHSQRHMGTLTHEYAPDVLGGQGGGMPVVHQAVWAAASALSPWAAAASASRQQGSTAEALPGPASVRSTAAFGNKGAGEPCRPLDGRLPSDSHSSEAHETRSVLPARRSLW